VPEHVDDAVLTALEKLPADRFASAADFAAALKGDSGRTTGVRRTGSPVRRSRGVLVLGGIAAVATIAAAILAFRDRPGPATPVTRLTLDIPDLRVNHTGFFGTSLAISRDGSRFAFVARPGIAETRLLVRERGDLEARTLAGTEGADGPFMSPDGQWVGYFAGSKVFKVPAAGGAPVQLASDASRAIPSGVWLDDGRIFYTGSEFTLKSVASAGGPASEIFPAPSLGGAVYPVVLPRKDVVLITHCGNNCTAPVLVALNLETQSVDTVLPGAARAYYLPQGILVAVRSDGSVVGGKFDSDALRFTREPALLLTGVQLELGIIPELDLSDEGTLVYLPASAGGSATVAEVDRAGRSRVLDPSWVDRFVSMNPSPDGRQVAASTLQGAGTTLWIKQLDAGPLIRLTFDTSAVNYRGAWLPDNRTVSFSSDANRRGTFLYGIRADGSNRPERLFPDDSAQVDEAHWSRDGQWLAYRTGTVPGVRDVYVRRLQGDQAPIPVAAGSADEYMPAISPNGRWVAYVSLESGREEVYVRPLPQVDRARWQVSPSGGTSPVWSHRGDELFYVAAGDTMMAASVRETPDFQLTGRQALFSTRRFAFTPWHQAFGLRPDDQSFLMLQPITSSDDEAGRRLVVTLNWLTDVEARLAVRE
jgi:serine/threonine-protein kinase